LETRVRERTAELSQAYTWTDGLNHLKGLLLVTKDLNEKLKLITDALVEIFHVDFARIWLIKKGDRCDSGCMYAGAKEPFVCRDRDSCLHLMVSSGRYTHINGQMHRRIPLGCFQIGKIVAREDYDFLTNDAIHDPRVQNHEWAKELGLVSFAGYRLFSTTGEPVGVLALFSQHAISEEEDVLLEGVANTTSQVIQTAMAEEELERAHQRLIKTSHQAGMAEVATDVLHNVGNVLNSINVSANYIQDIIMDSKAKNLKKVVDMISDHTEDLGAFLTQDERGKHIPVYLAEAAKLLVHEHSGISEKVRSLVKNVGHIKQIIKAQQGYARAGGLEVFVNINEVIEDAIEINSAILSRIEVRLELDLAELPRVLLDKQRVLQILVNLITNAENALSESKQPDKLLVIKCYQHNEDTLRIEVKDNGVGIPKENLAKIFRHGFTTRKDGHGFGLHSSALTAKEMRGALTAHSDGPGQGATFTLEMPFVTRKEKQESGDRTSGKKTAGKRS
ncbi:MAG: GHKL domain-containing protein, partial [Sedimentisphaerales bacterium]|nr:GHKL domain-containing protein [Sedimentisphaerales bacterium]